LASSHPVLTLHPSEWPPDWREAWEERAAIMEHHGGRPRKAAECDAAGLLRVAYRRKMAARWKRE